jgi:hypothetical protein
VRYSPTRNLNRDQVRKTGKDCVLSSSQYLSSHNFALPTVPVPIPAPRPVPGTHSWKPHCSGAEPWKGVFAAASCLCRLTSLAFLLQFSFQYHCLCPSPCQVCNLGKFVTDGNADRGLSTHLLAPLLGFSFSQLSIPVPVPIPVPLPASQPVPGTEPWKVVIGDAEPGNGRATFAAASCIC